MNTENSKTNDSHKFIYQFTDKLNLKAPNNKNAGLVNLSIYYTWKTSSLNTTTINLKFSLQLWMMNLIYSDGSYSISDIQDYFEFIVKKNETLTENLSIQVYPNKIKTGSFLK